MSLWPSGVARTSPELAVLRQHSAAAVEDDTETERIDDSARNHEYRGEHGGGFQEASKDGTPGLSPANQRTSLHLTGQWRSGPLHCDGQ